jgi:predicted dehydrogenase
MTQVRWGIVGAGRIAHTFARDLALCDNASLAAVAARDVTNATTFARQYRAHEALGGYEALYASDAVDAVYVATPHNLHLQHASDALRAGKAVLCEKPITTNAAECQQLLDVATETGSYLMEAMWTWFLPAIRKAKAWVDAGRIGDLQHINADFGYPQNYSPTKREYDASLAGGCLLEMGVYPVAIARYFSGRAPNDMDVRARHAPNGVEDHVAMVFDYDDFIATLATSFRCRLPNSACIVGGDGWIVIPDFFRASECLLYALDEQVDHFRDDREGSGFEFQVAAVSDDILNGRTQSGIVTHADSLGFQQDMDRVRARF